MDASGSIEQSGWDRQKEEVINIIRSFDPESDGVRYGLVRYSSSGSVEKLHYFNNNQDLDYIENLVDGLSWTGGQSATRTALKNAMDIVEWTGPEPVFDEDEALQEAAKNYYIENVQITFILISDGNPYPYNEQNPCKCGYKQWSSTDRGYYYAARAIRDDLAEWGIEVIIVGIGGDWNPSPLSCLVDDEPTQVFFIDDLNDSPFLKMCNRGFNSHDYLCGNEK